MAYPSWDEAQVYKAKTISSRIRVAVGLDYPVFSGAFSDTFPGAALDTDKWFSFIPTWGNVTVAGGTVSLTVTGQAISMPYIQSRHNLAFPLHRDTDWTFDIRCRFPNVYGFGAFIRICGRSFRDAEAIWGLKANTADGLLLNAPDGFSVQNTIWSTAGAGSDWRRYRVTYDASAATYLCEIDQNDDGAYETAVVVPVAGRYADAIVIGNSTAIQGALGDWTEIEVDSVSVSGTAEEVEDPDWAAPFTYDGTRFTYLPTVLSGRVSIDKDNAVDAAEVTLDNFGLDEQMLNRPQLYTWMRFLNRRAIIEGQATDDMGHWTDWEVLFDALCGEKRVRLDENGQCRLNLPMRDRYRAQADDMEILACYADAPVAIQGVDMNMTVAQIIEDIFQVKSGLDASAMSVVATPNNIPRNYNVFRQSAMDAVNTLAEHAALAVYQDRTNAQIQVQEWPWGTDTPGYHMSTAEEIRFLEWSESAFDVTSAEQLSFENTETTDIAFAATWPPHAEPWWGRRVHDNSVAAQNQVALDARPISALKWWARNRHLGGIEVVAPAQFWVDHDLEIGIKDDRFLGFGRDESWIVDGWEHSWEGESVAITRIRLINAHPDRFLRQNLPG